jgi:hypothetical protein
LPGCQRFLYRRTCPPRVGIARELIRYSGLDNGPSLFECESCGDRYELEADGMLHRTDD